MPLKTIRNKLHQLFVRATHATSDVPIEIKPLPTPYNWEQEREKFFVGEDLSTNMDGSQNPDKKKSIEQLFDNTYENAKNSIIYNEPKSTIKDKLSYLPLVRKTVPSMVAWEIVGVQPMTNPVGQIYTLRSKDTSPSQEQQRTTIQVIKEIVEAKTRKLRARYSLEIQKNEIVIPGFNLEEEILNAVASEIVAEFDVELLREIKEVAATTLTVLEDTSDLAGIEITGNSLAITILRMCNIIAERGGRGPGNWCIVSPTALTYLVSSTNATKFVGLSDEEKKKIINSSPNIAYAGKINDSVKVYVNPCAGADEPIIVGYKGTTSMDSAIQFCPYVPIISSGAVVDTTTFQPVIAFMTRYGLWKSPFAPNHYGLVQLIDKNSVPVEEIVTVSDAPASKPKRKSKKVVDQSPDESNKVALKQDESEKKTKKSKKKDSDGFGR